MMGRKSIFALAFLMLSGIALQAVSDLHLQLCPVEDGCGKHSSQANVQADQQGELDCHDLDCNCDCEENDCSHEKLLLKGRIGKTSESFVENRDAKLITYSAIVTKSIPACSYGLDIKPLHLQFLSTVIFLI